MNEIIIYTHKDCILKDNGKNHPENEKRLKTIINSIKEIHNPNIHIKNCSLINIENVYLVHPKNYIKKIFKSIPKKGLIGVEKEPSADTILCPNSKNAILRACGAGIDSVDTMIKGKYSKFFCAIRPPGHHAETTRSNGFCFINNIAVTAKYLQNKYNFKKIGIIDFDVHHGNGTQEIFYNNPNVFYGSIHQIPLFPGTGLITEKGQGNIFNAPILPNTNSNEFIDIYEKEIISNLDKFKPEIILISAGFDAHQLDPLSNINLSSEDYYQITKIIANIANIHSKGRIISFLEGGYNMQALHESVKHHINALIC